jgi:hypothetical protein
VCRSSKHCHENCWGVWRSSTHCHENCSIVWRSYKYCRKNCSNMCLSIVTTNVVDMLNPLTPKLNPSAQSCLTRFFTGDFASWTVRFVNILVCVKHAWTWLINWMNNWCICWFYAYFYWGF